MYEMYFTNLNQNLFITFKCIVTIKIENLSCKSYTFQMLQSRIYPVEHGVLKVCKTKNIRKRHVCLIIYTIKTI